MIFKVLQMVMLFLFFLFIWTQMVWPALQEKPLFPFFRSKTKGDVE